MIEIKRHKLINIRVKKYSTLSFDYNCDKNGQILLKNENDEIVECKVVKANTLNTKYIHVSWLLDAEQKYTLELSKEIIENITIENGWCYDKNILDNGGVCFSFIDGCWNTYHSLEKSLDINSTERLKYHFIPKKAWMNDPNGLIYFKGKYHLFYQYYPYGAHTGMLHWGHAISDNLIYWRHLPIAIYPQNDLCDRYIGGAFSGSAMTINNNIYIAYTEHFEDTRSSPKIFIEKQNAITSKDGVTFSQPKTIVNRKPDICSHDFRDPKVWYDEKHKSYYMIIGTFAQGFPSVAMYSSKNTRNWAFHSILFQEKNETGRSLECPDLFYLDGKYVLILSIFETVNGVDQKHRTFYYIGDFDGKYFTPETDAKLIDLGIEFYAIQTFLDKNNKRIGIAWINSWSDIKRKQRTDFAGAMSLPRVLRLKNNLLYTYPVNTYKSLRKNSKPDFYSENKNTDVSLSSNQVELNMGFNIDASWTLKIHSLSDVEVLNLIYKNGSLKVHNNCSNIMNFAETPTINNRYIDLDIFLDSTSIEIFVNHGEHSITMRYDYDQNIKNELSLILDKNSNFFMEGYYLQSIWK